MAEATIGALRVVLGADTAQFENKLDGALGTLAKFGKKAFEIASGIQLQKIFEQSVQAIVSTVKSAVDMGDKFAKAADKFGIPGDRLLLLSTAAQQSEVSLDDLGTAFVKLSKSMVETAAGGVTPAASAFKALKINVEAMPGVMKTNEQVLLEVADAFSRFEGAEVKAALSTAIFSKSGAQFINFLNQGSAGIKKFTDEMERQGLVVSPATLKAAEALSDKIQLLGSSILIATLKLLGQSGLIQSMYQLVSATQEAVAWIGRLNDTMERQSTSQKLFSSALQISLLQLKLFTNPFAAIKDIATSTGPALVSTWTDPHPAVVQLTKDMEEYLKVLERIRLGPPIFDPKEAANLKAFQDKLAGIKAESIELSGVHRGQLAPGFLAAAQSMELLKGQVAGVGTSMLVLGANARLLNDEMFKLAGQKFIFESLPAWQQWDIQVQVMTASLQRLGKTSEEIGIIIARTAEKSGHSWKNATTDILQNTASGFAELARVNKKYAGIAKGLAYAQAIWSTYTGAAKALELYGPTPWGFAAAAAAVVFGLAQVAKISAQEFAMGGSFKIPGGIGGVDTKMIPLALSPGERVDITPAGRERDRGGIGGSNEIILSGISGRDFFTGTMLRDLIDALNQGERDGYRLKFAER